MKNAYKIVSLVLGFALLSGCAELPNNPKANLPPHTYLTLFPDSIISPQRTLLTISWWGDDPDGFVVGFYFSFDSLNWTFTTKNDSTFQLSMNGLDSTFRFWVAAVDNKGLRDPHPASNRYPVMASPPSVSFNAGTSIPDTTFTIASFAWTGHDPDGDNTVKYYYWAVNDTSTWHKIPSSITTITLTQDSGIIPNAPNRFYLKAQSIASLFSPVIKMPDSNGVWYVRKPVGRFLMISDYYRTPPTDFQGMLDFYQSAFDTMQYSVLDIKVGGGVNVPPIVNPMFIQTLKLFKCVVWVAWRGNNASDNTDFDLATQSIPYFVLAGGKVLFTTGFANTLIANDVATFASIDSVSANEYTGFTVQYPVIVADNNYDTLYTGSQDPLVYNIDRVRTLYPGLQTHVIYKLQDPNNPSNIGVVCTKDNNVNPSVVFMSLALHRMNYTGTAINFFRRVINVDFGMRKR